MGWFGDPINSGAGNRNREGKASNARPSENAHWNDKKAKKKRQAKRREKRQNQPPKKGWFS